MKPIVSAALFIIYPDIWCGLDALSGRFFGALYSEYWIENERPCQFASVEPFRSMGGEDRILNRQLAFETFEAMGAERSAD